MDDEKNGKQKNWLPSYQWFIGKATLGKCWFLFFYLLLISFWKQSGSFVHLGWTPRPKPRLRLGHFKGAVENLVQDENFLRLRHSVHCANFIGETTAELFYLRTTWCLHLANGQALFSEVRLLRNTYMSIVRRNPGGRKCSIDIQRKRHFVPKRLLVSSLGQAMTLAL